MAKKKTSKDSEDKNEKLTLAEQVLAIFPAHPSESYVTVSDEDVKKLRELAEAE